MNADRIMILSPEQVVDLTGGIAIEGFTPVETDGTRCAYYTLNLCGWPVKRSLYQVPQEHRTGTLQDFSIRPSVTTTVPSRTDRGRRVTISPMGQIPPVLYNMELRAAVHLYQKACNILDAAASNVEASSG